MDRATNLGLVLFLAVMALNLAGLALDLLLLHLGVPTISERVWRQPLLGIPILVWQGMGIVGLAVHFYGN